MHPTLYEAPGGMAIHTYGMFILLAFCSAFLLVHWRAQQIGFHPDRLLGVYVASAVGGLIGGRILYTIAVEPSILWTDPGHLFAFSGFAVYGGVIGGAIGVALVSKAVGLDVWKMTDVAAPAVVLGMGVGRFACFFAGCCHGVVANVGPLTPLLPKGLLEGQIYWSPQFPFVTTEFYGGVGRLQNVPLYPTQLWDAFLLVGLAIVLTSLWNRRRFDGELGALALLLEPVIRIFVESFRADQRGYFVTFPAIEPFAHWLPGLLQAGDSLESARMGITTSQALGLAAMVFGGVLMIVRWNAGIAPEVPVEIQEDADLPVHA
jgi:phosphatidylglycerol:prolipoprotein diacylglycerol transferase